MAIADTIILDRDIINRFARAVETNNIPALEHLLSDSGTFDIQDNELETIETGKKDFISWFSNKLSATQIFKTDFDVCLHCAVGERVILFNNGQFPRKAKGTYERSKTGLMLSLKNNQINTLKFCFVFAETNNPYLIDCKRCL